MAKNIVICCDDTGNQVEAISRMSLSCYGFLIGIKLLWLSHRHSCWA
jgi:hypothetical protein